MKFKYADFEPMKNTALKFPGVEECLSHNQTPSIKVNGKFLCRLPDEGTFVPIRIGFENRKYYLEKYPEIFRLPDHFKNYPYICFWIPLHNQKLLEEIIGLSWKNLATKKQLKDFENFSL